jgi:catechol 2,3-dioxygenase-like lactoylglutathione lyase family enzyme
MITVKEIAFAGYPVTDIARARGFYEGRLGLTPASQFEHQGRHWIEYEVGGGTLAVTNMSPQWKPSSSGPSVAPEVTDFAAAVAELKAHAIPFAVEPMDSGVCQLAVVHDPDGNAIVIHQRKHT